MSCDECEGRAEGCEIVHEEEMLLNELPTMPVLGALDDFAEGRCPQTTDDDSHHPKEDERHLEGRRVKAGLESALGLCHYNFQTREMYTAESVVVRKIELYVEMLVSEEIASAGAYSATAL